MKGVLFSLFVVLLSLLVSPEARGDVRPPFSPPLTLTGELRGGVGADGLSLWGDERPTSAFAEGRLALRHLPLDITATLLVRHFTSDDGYWVGKRKLVAGLLMPLSRDLSVFSEWERKYSTGDNWLLTGVSLRFTAFGRR